MLDTLTSFVTLLLALSVATERLVELVKGFFPALNGPKPVASVEASRELKIHFLSLVAAAPVVYLMQDYIAATLKLNSISWPLEAALAILASGGSSAWNSVLTYLLSAKNIKRQDEFSGEKVGNADLGAALPMSMPTL